MMYALYHLTATSLEGHVVCPQRESYQTLFPNSSTTPYVILDQNGFIPDSISDQKGSQTFLSY